jgi:hypothetical protein
MTPANTRPLSDDWLLPVGVVIGMALGEDVHIAGRVSESLLTSMEEIQRIAVLRRDALEHIRITADEVGPAPRAERPRVVSCFSAGVDAFYTVLDPGLEIDGLLYVHGLEAHVGDQRMLALALPQIRAAALELGRPLRLAETNWRSVIEPLAGNDYFVTMPLLFAIAHLMASEVTRLIVPGTHDPYFALENPSSVCSYVRLWGTQGLETVEHGHVPRFEKVRRLTESDVAMRRLRVCWGRRHPVYNCGHCVKCTRTRVQLKLAGAEGRCLTLPPRLTLREIRRAEPETPDHVSYIDENIAEAESQGLTDLAAALRFQRDQPAGATTWGQAARAESERFLRGLFRSYRKRRFDSRLRSLKQEAGFDHLFNYIRSDPHEEQT